MTPDQAADVLMRLEAGWNEAWPAATIDVWYPMVLELDYADTYEAVTELIRISERRPTFAVLRGRTEMVAHRRQPDRPARPCLRCNTVEAEPDRTRCAACQAIIDDEVTRGQSISPAMAAAVAAAHRRPR
jgi:hypothetical protein